MDDLRSARPAGAPEQYSVDIRRADRKVVVTFTSETEYGAIALFDTLVNGLQKGDATLRLNPMAPTPDADL